MQCIADKDKETALQMAEQQYMEALPHAERKLLKTFLEQLLAGAAQAIPVDPAEITQLLTRLPYPTLQILASYRTHSLIGSIISNALETLINTTDPDSTLKFINFLANFPLNALQSTPALHPRLTLKLSTLQSTPLGDKAFLALLSRPETNLLIEVLEQLKYQWQSCKVGIPSKEFVLYQALSKKLHFVPLISVQLKDALKVSDVGLRNNLLILKLTEEFSNTSQKLSDVGNVGKWLQAFVVEESPEELQEIHKFFYADFRRIAAILQFLQKYPESFKVLTIKALLQTTGILKIVYDHEIKASFDELRDLITNIYKWQQLIPAAKSLHELELETLNYYAALSIIYDVILADTSVSLEQYYTQKMQQLNTLLRQMHNIDVLCSLIEDIFQLIFLRWEHLRYSDSNPHLTELQKQRSKSTRSSSSISTDDAAADTPTTSLLASARNSHGLRHGFICRGRALQNIFGFLKKFVTKKLHAEEYKQASERIQLRFQRIIDIISEALWKYAVLQKIDDSLIRAGPRQQYLLEAEELLHLVQMHADILEKTSSDDECHERSNYRSLTRRKAAKKKRRATFSGAVLTQPASSGRSVLDAAKQAVAESRARANVMVTSVNIVQDTTVDAVTQVKARKLFTSFANRSIIPKMLGAPEDLAVMALTLKNFNDVKYIIENFNLQNTDLNRELSFVEQQQQVKLKLTTIYTSYQEQEQHSRRDNREPKATVEQIKNVAAKGFEVSKIISVIDNFAQSQRIQQPPELKQLLLKHKTNPEYYFLREFEERNLNAVIVADLILNLPFNTEITTNILMVIKRQQQISAGIMADSNEATSMGKTQLPQQIGAMPLLENLSECLRLLERTTLRELLYDNYYSLKPQLLLRELQREAAFQQIFYKKPAEIGTCSALRMHAPLFENLQSKCNYHARFTAYVTHLAKLLQLRDPNLEYHTSALLKIDPCDVIGELIFECNMTPLEIETNVAALNLNLVHVIALNICPEISDNGLGSSSVRPASTQKLQTILNYIANQNELLAYLLEGIMSTNSTHANACQMNRMHLQRLLQLPEIEKLANLYAGNKLIAALRSDSLSWEMVKRIESKLEQLHILQLQIGIREPRIVHAARVDNLIVELIREDAKHINLAAHLNDITLKAKLIQENFTKIATTRLAKELIETTLQHKDAATRIPEAVRIQLEHTLADITVYAKVSEVLQFETWPQAYDFGMKTPNKIFEKLLQLHLYKLCYKWCCVVQLTARFAQYKRLFLNSLLNALLELHDDQVTLPQGVEVNRYLLQILETFPVEDCVSFLNANKDKLRSLELLRYAIDFLAVNKPDDSFKNYKISLVIFEQLTPSERAHFWGLLRYPLLIIEQLIMNAKLEILSKVLTAVRARLQCDGVAHTPLCDFCFDKSGHLYDIHTRSGNSPQKVQFQLGIDTSNTKNSAFILLNFNLYQKDHVITNECIDLLLRIYGTKALDYHISHAGSASAEQISHSTDIQQSLDSLCGAFQMPAVAPARSDWIRDEDATHCMCCKRAAFTMLMRRHHCRRCGRVVCFACSAHRMRIPELYEDVEVRICNDCFRNSEELQRSALRDYAENGNGAVGRVAQAHEADMFKWQLSGNITHDKLLREEFCYEHAPSVGLCLTILGYHAGQQKCVDLLLYHCRKLEKLFVPNPEVDFELVAKMMNCLALAAKVRGGPAEIETIREHSEIIMSVVQNGCESLIPPGPLNNHSLRKLGDSLVQAEKWQLALDVHLKCGFPTTGVMAAHGLSCLRAGCFDTARDKFSHCMPKLSNELANSRIYKSILNPAPLSNDNNDNTSDQEHDIIKRPQRGPPLLQELLKTIELTPASKPQPETLQRASIIRNSNTSLASLLTRRKEPYVIPMHEPALNVLTTLANLKRITKGQYNEGNSTHADKSTLRQTRGFEESMHYVLTYGSHTDVLQFLMRHQELNAALKYFLLQKLDPELFIHNIYLVCLRCGQVPELITQMLSVDSRMFTWRHTLLQTCRYLETQNLLNSLYQLQVLLKDPVRASMTCVKFYAMNCETFQQMHANALHLHNAHKHLQSELELAQWDINLEPEQRRKNSTSNSRRSSTSTTTSVSLAAGFLMQMDARSLNSHINTILEQLEVAKFLAICEKENTAEGETEPVTVKTLKQLRIEPSKTTLPTLFDSTPDRIHICILILLCGKNIEEGFGLAYRIIQYYKLPPMKVFGATAKYLARNQRLPEVERLLSCITTNNGTSTRDIDDILSIAINSAINSHEPEVKTALDNLAKKINSIELRISSHIFIGQLKSAYLLANKYERLTDIRRILRQAELTNQIHIKKLCEKKLNMNATPQRE